MKKFTIWLLCLTMLVAAVSLAGCGAKAESAQTPEGVKTVDNNLEDMSWEEILAEAKGQTVNWYAWGGSKPANTFIQEKVAKRAAEYGVTLNWVTVSNLTDAINITLAEKQAGLTNKGEVDMLWINGGNFMTAQQAGILFGPWAQKLENSKYVNWDSSTINTDLGFPVNGMESPWASTVRMQVYDTARTDIETLPQNFNELVEWIKANPGKYTYCPPPVFAGTRLIKEWIYNMIGDEVLTWDASKMSKEEFYEKTKPVWDLLEELHPYMWREGTTFPKDISEMDKMFSNGEIDLTYLFIGTGIEGKINEGVYPVTAKPYCMEQALGDTNYVAITYNSDNKAGAMVVANIILEPEIQAMAAKDISFGPVLDVSRMSDTELTEFNDVISTIDQDYYIPSDRIAQCKIPEFSGAFNSYIEAIWSELFLK